MRVLFVAANSLEAASARYRCSHIAEALASHDSTCTIELISAQSDMIRVAHDVVVLHRLRWELAAPFLDAARRTSARVVYSTDDLIFTPDFAYHVGFLYPDDPTRYVHHRAEAESQVKTLRESDAVIVSTEYLRQRVHACIDARKPVFVLPNVLSRAIVGLSDAASAHREPDRRARVFGYLSGSATHDGDFATIASPLASVMRTHPDTSLMVVGELRLPPVLQFLTEEGRLARHPFVPWRDLPGLIALADINLAPLDMARPFNKAKSAVKWLEASPCSVPTIATPADGFAEQANSQTCLLPNSPAEWQSTLELVLNDPAVADEIVQNARASVLSRYTTDAIANDAGAVFREILGNANASGEVVISRPLLQRIVRSLRKSEARLFDMCIRLNRHRHLLWAERERGGTLQ